MPDNRPTDLSAAETSAAGRSAAGNAVEHPAAAPQSEVPDQLQDELQELRGELDQVKDHALRCQADLENYRRRVAREMNDERRYANLQLLRDLLPVLDNMERAIDAAEKANEAGGLLQGFQMVAKQLETLLQQYHCVKIDALHEEFDPARHEAIYQQPSSEFPPHTVVQVVRNGYMLHERVVRPSQVIVSAPVPGSEQTAPCPDGQPQNPRS